MRAEKMPTQKAARQNIVGGTIEKEGIHEEVETDIYHDQS